MSSRFPRRARPLVALVIASAVAGAPAFAADDIVVRAEGLGARGTISYDHEGVPLIRAKTENDAAFLLGYAHARDRLFQMDFNRRAARGTLAEILGPAALAQDVQIRTLGLGRAARASLERLSDDTRGWLTAYANGANAWIRHNPPPQEYGALELTRVAPWTALDSVAVAKLLAFQLSFSLDLDYTVKLGAYQQAGAAKGFNGTALFFEDTHRVQPADDRISLPGFLDRLGGARAKAAPAGDASFTVSPAAVELARAYRDANIDNPILGRALRALDGRGGSNGWVVAARHSATGAPLVANDPHLSFQAPNLFHEARVIGGTTLDARGIAMPGLPSLPFACTPTICWGVTSNHMDVTDVFEERFVTNTYGLPTHTIHQGRYEPVQWVFQTYKVNTLDGTPDNLAPAPGIGYANGGVTFVVPRRNHGPVIQFAGDKGLSVQYAGWGATSEIEGMRRLNRARNFDEFRDASLLLDVGSVNLQYGDTAGNIAQVTTGEMPLRDDLQHLGRPDGQPPFIVRDGSGARRHEWLPATSPERHQALRYAILPNDEMPIGLNPAQGYIANANNDLVGATLDNDPFNERRPGGGSYYMNWYFSTYRIGRVDRLIDAAIARGDKISLADMKQWQANNQLLEAELLLPHFLASADAAATSDWAPLREIAQDPRVAEAVARLRAWDFSTPTGIREGYDAGDDPAALPAPSADEVARSVAATLYAGWRGDVVRGVIDDTIAKLGIQAPPVGSATSPQQGGREALAALQFHLDGFPLRRGIGVSGVDFFAVPGAPSREAARDFLIMRALRDAIARFTGPDFAVAFGPSPTLDDLRWGRLHRVVFRHALRGPFDVPDANAVNGFAHLSPQLPGLARGGGYEAVDDGEHDIRAKTPDGFMFTSGVVQRFVASMTPQPQVEQLLYLGQRGVTGDPLYTNQLGRWLVNDYKPARDDRTTNAVRTITLDPASP